MKNEIEQIRWPVMGPNGNVLAASRAELELVTAQGGRQVARKQETSIEGKQGKKD